MGSEAGMAGKPAPEAGELAIQNNNGGDTTDLVAVPNAHALRSTNDILASCSGNSGSTMEGLISNGAINTSFSQNFEKLDYYERLAVLQALHGLDSGPDQRLVGVLTPLVSVTLGSGVVAGATSAIASGAGTLAVGVGVVAAGSLVVAIGSLFALLRVGKRESKFEKSRAAAVKVLEDVHKRASTQEEKSNAA